MRFIPESIRRILIDYISVVSCKISIEKMVLFGDYARGNYTPESEINIAVFSSFFEGMPCITAVQYLFAVASRFQGNKLVLYPFSYRDYMEGTGLAAVILESGVEVYDHINGFINLESDVVYIQ